MLYAGKIPQNQVHENRLPVEIVSCTNQYFFSFDLEGQARNQGGARGVFAPPPHTHTHTQTPKVRSYQVKENSRLK